MEVDAAQIDKLDQNVGKIVNKLKALGLFENTIICFMSDNGGNYEEMGRMPPGLQRPSYIPYETKDGLEVVPGNDPAVMPSPATTYAVTAFHGATRATLRSVSTNIARMRAGYRHLFLCTGHVVSRRKQRRTRVQMETGLAVSGHLGASRHGSRSNRGPQGADQHPDRTKKRSAEYAAWAKRVGVQPWRMPQTPARPTGDGAMPSPEYLLRDRNTAGH